MKRLRISALGWFLGITVVGFLWRFAPLHLPWFAWKYGGSLLWAAGLYFLVVAVVPGLRPVWVGVVTAGLAVVVEFSRLLHAPGPPGSPASVVWLLGWLDHFRHTLAGKLTLGSVYSPRNIVAYWVGVGVAVWVDLKFSGHSNRPTPAQSE